MLGDDQRFLTFEHILHLSNAPIIPPRNSFLKKMVAKLWYIGHESSLSISESHRVYSATGNAPRRSLSDYPFVSIQCLINFASRFHRLWKRSFGIAAWVISSLSPGEILNHTIGDTRRSKDPLLAKCLARSNGTDARMQRENSDWLGGTLGRWSAAVVAVVQRILQCAWRRSIFFV